MKKQVKLKLKKSIVSNLNEKEMEQLKGGYGLSITICGPSIITVTLPICC
ncbi:TIGR04149 family rSAM-modified RiPP [Maribacter sp. 2-571]